MFLVLLKIKDKIYFEGLDSQEEMVEFIDSIEKKFGGIEYPKSVIITGSDDDINQIIEMIEEQYYLYIVGRKIDEKVYKELLALIDGLSIPVQITFGIEFDETEDDEEEYEAEEPTELPKPTSHGTELNSEMISSIVADTEPDPIIEAEPEFENTKYSVFVLWYSNKVVITMGDEAEAGYDESKSFKQSFDNLDEAMALFEGFKHDFMEILDNETDLSFDVDKHLEMVHQFIENKILMMEWKDTQSIKYMNGRYRQHKVESEKTNPMEDHDFLTAKEVMKLLRISDQTLANWRRNNLIDYKKISNRKYLYVVDSVNDIFENGVDTEGVSNVVTITPAVASAQIKKIVYEDEIMKMLKPLAFKIPEYKLSKQNFFLNFGNVGLSSSPQAMINDNFQLVDVIKKNVIFETPKEVYEYLVGLFSDGKEPRLDTSKKILSGYSKFYLNKLYDGDLVSPKVLQA